MEKILVISMAFILFLIQTPSYASERVVIIEPFLKDAMGKIIELSNPEDNAALLKKVITNIHKDIKKQGFLVAPPDFYMDDKYYAHKKQKLRDDEKFGAFFLADLVSPTEASKYNINYFILIGFVEKSDCMSVDEVNCIQVNIVAVETGRQYIKELPVNTLSSKNISNKLGLVVLEGLRHSDQLSALPADKISNVKKSIVTYYLPTERGENLQLNVDYDSSHNYIQKVDFIFKEKITDGEYTYVLKSEHNERFNLNLKVQNNKVVDYSVSAKFRYAQKNDNFHAITVVSIGGNRTNFNFIKQGGGFQLINISPAVNPYTPHAITMDESSKKIVNYDLSPNK